MYLVSCVHVSVQITLRVRWCVCDRVRVCVFIYVYRYVCVNCGWLSSIGCYPQRKYQINLVKHLSAHPSPTLM